jgi:hypothetical protein
MTLCIWETRTLHSARSGHASTAERESWSDELVSQPPEKPWTLFELERSSILSASAGRKERVLAWMWSEKAQGRRAQTVRVLCTRGARPGAVSGGGGARAERRARLRCSDSKRSEARQSESNIRNRGSRSYTAIELRVIPWAGIAVVLSIQRFHHHIHIHIHRSLGKDACFLYPIHTHTQSNNHILSNPLQ